jgi:hypothetical protein
VASGVPCPATLGALLAAFVGLEACRSTPERRFEPSRDPGIELATFEDRSWSAKPEPVILSYSLGSHRKGLAGFHVDADGRIWAFEYPARRAPGQCDALDLAANADDFARCFYADSVLLGRLRPEILVEVLRHAGSLSDGERLKSGGPQKDAGGLEIELPGYGTREGKSIIVAACPPREQLSSPDAQFFILLFHRVGRAVPQFALSKDSCQARYLGSEIVPGVQGWWVPPAP